MPKLSAQIEDIDSEIEQLNFKKDALLRKAGWEATSQTEGCLWLWRKEIQGRTYLVSREAALAVEYWLEEFEPRDDVPIVTVREK